jgi:hypothetical protein
MRKLLLLTRGAAPMLFVMSSVAFFNCCYSARTMGCGQHFATGCDNLLLVTLVLLFAQTAATSRHGCWRWCVHTQQCCAHDRLLLLRIVGCGCCRLQSTGSSSRCTWVSSAGGLPSRTEPVDRPAHASATTPPDCIRSAWWCAVQDTFQHITYR